MKKIFNKRCDELKRDGGILKTADVIFYYEPGYIQHRDDGPAYNSISNKHKRWYIHDKLHREDGPAIEYTDGDKWWYYNNKCIMTTQGDVTQEQLIDFKLRIL